MRYTHLLLFTMSLGLTACPLFKPEDRNAPPADVKAEEVKPAEAKPAEAPAEKPAEVPAPVGPTDEKAAAPAEGVLGVGATPADITTDAPHQYGASFTVNTEAVALAAAISDIDKHEGPVKVKAEVEKVCQAKGCWFTLKAPDVPIPVRVKMKGYAFFVPKNGMGAEAVLEGKLKKTTIDQATAQHYADDEAAATGKPARKVEGPQDAYEFTATAVQLTRIKG
jgi:hypothetical protein